MSPPSIKGFAAQLSNLAETAFIESGLQMDVEFKRLAEIHMNFGSYFHNHWPVSSSSRREGFGVYGRFGDSYLSPLHISFYWSTLII